MNTMKKLVALFLAAALMAVALTGCSMPWASSSLGEKYVDAYIDHVNDVRSRGSAKLKNDEKIAAMCTALLEKLNENGEVSEENTYWESEEADGYIVIKLELDEMVGDYNTGRVITAEVVTELKTKKATMAANYPGQLEKLTKRYDKYTAIGAAYRTIGDKVYAAYGYKTAD